MKRRIRTVPMASRALVAICKKCGKKLGGGFGGGFGDGGRKPLAKALRNELDLPKWKRSPVRIVETTCMKLCPKGAVAVMTGGDAGRVHVVPAGTSVAAVAAYLGLTRGDDAPRATPQPSRGSVVPLLRTSAADPT